MMGRQVETHCDGDNSLDTMRDKLKQNQNLEQNKTDVQQ